MIKCFAFENFKSFEKAATGLEWNTILDGMKSTGAIVR